jgi:hypothetical protein
MMPFMIVLGSWILRRIFDGGDEMSNQDVVETLKELPLKTLAQMEDNIGERECKNVDWIHLIQGDD